MNDIASSLEQEFAGQARTNREARITELRQLESNGRGSVEIKPHAILLPLLFGIVGVLMVWAALTSSSLPKTGNIIVIVLGVVFAVTSVWGMFGPRKPRLTLTEEGVRVKDALLPWSSIEDYGITVHSTNGFPTHTSVEFEHAAGFTPPKLGLFYMFGGSSRNRKTDQYTTRLTLHTGARGMNGDKLAKCIGDFLSAARARAELARLQAL